MVELFGKSGLTASHSRLRGLNVGRAFRQVCRDRRAVKGLGE